MSVPSCEVSFWVLMSGVAAALIFSVSCYIMIRAIMLHVMKFTPPSFTQHDITVSLPEGGRRKHDEQ